MPTIQQSRAAVESTVLAALKKQPIVDMHTHLYPPTFGTPVPNKTGKTDPAGLMLWGLDELITYHYLIAEVYRVVPATQLPYEKFWAMSKTQQADHIWKHLFVERPPVSEACRGVLTCLNMLGLDMGKKDLTQARKWFAEQDPDKYIDKVMELSNIQNITMTNPVFDTNERNRWLASPEKLRSDPRFKSVLRMDPVLRNWPLAASRLNEWGFDAGDGEKLTDENIEEGRRFLREWIDRQQAVYMAVSLPPDFRYPAEQVDDNVLAQAGQTALEKIVLPVAAERGIPFAMMIGSRLQVNPALKDAGDVVGLSDVQSVVHLCASFPQNKFFVTMLARENQHELCVAARKFGNLMVFGCWWFLNNPILIEEMTRMRLELLGTTIIPQHSDSRVLDQLLYKWNHTRKILGKVLTDKYADIVETHWPLTDEDIQKDIELLLQKNFTTFLTR